LSFPKWVQEIFTDPGIYIKRGNAGSHQSLFNGKILILFYYYANNWVYCNLQFTSDAELEQLKTRLLKPESIVERKDKYKQVRFHLVNENDLDVLKDILKKKLASTQFTLNS